MLKIFSRKKISSHERMNIQLIHLVIWYLSNRVIW